MDFYSILINKKKIERCKVYTDEQITKLNKFGHFAGKKIKRLGRKFYIIVEERKMLFSTHVWNAARKQRIHLLYFLIILQTQQ